MAALCGTIVPEASHEASFEVELGREGRSLQLQQRVLAALGAAPSAILFSAAAGACTRAFWVWQASAQLNERVSRQFGLPDVRGDVLLLPAGASAEESARKVREKGVDWQGLPDGVTQHVFSMLRFTDVCACAAVCQAWREAVQHDEIQSKPPLVLLWAAEFGNVSAMVALAEDMWERGEAVRSLEWSKKAARKGHQGSQFRIGEVLYRGQGPWNRDEEEALAWLLRAARNPEGERRLTAASALLLGYMYMDGEGTQHSDNSEAVKWLKAASELGCNEAEQTVGWLWNTGQY